LNPGKCRGSSHPHPAAPGITSAVSDRRTARDRRRLRRRCPRARSLTSRPRRSAARSTTDRWCRSRLTPFPGCN
jgi:hypothetical protein